MHNGTLDAVLGSTSGCKSWNPGTAGITAVTAYLLVLLSHAGYSALRQVGRTVLVEGKGVFECS